MVPKTTKLFSERSKLSVNARNKPSPYSEKSMKNIVFGRIGNGKEFFDSRLRDAGGLCYNKLFNCRSQRRIPIIRTNTG